MAGAQACSCQEKIFPWLKQWRAEEKGKGTYANKQGLK